MTRLPAILCAVLLAGCQAHTIVRNGANVKVLDTNATFASLVFRAADGTALTIINGDHVGMQRALAETITQRGNAVAAVISGAAAAALF